MEEKIQFYSYFHIRLTLFSLLVLGLPAAHGVSDKPIECHACLKSCKTTSLGKFDPNSCDCGDSDAYDNATCTGTGCFAKVEFFVDEEIAIVQKGCVNGLVKGVNGCHYAGQFESVHCYCEGPFCNNRHNFNSYTPKPLPTLECCECSQSNGDVCSADSCPRICRGNYCLLDFDGVEQGCGLGIPRLQSFLRIPNYLENFQGETTCARYQATLSTSVHGCVCTKPSGICNELEKMRHYQLENVIKRRIDDQNYCYSLHQRDYENPFHEDVFNRSETCEGHYCFVSLTTTELVIEVRNVSDSTSETQFFTGVSRPRFEILAGCLKVDKDEKVSIGCTSEYDANKQLISRHCICDSHLCNYFTMLKDNDHEVVAPVQPLIGKNISISDGNGFSPMAVLHDDATAFTASTANSPTIMKIIIYSIMIMTLLFHFRSTHCLS